MTQEQKAKAYDEALEKARKYHAAAKSINDPSAARYENIFPELRESEDERIIKWIANYIHAGVFTEDEHPMALKAVEWLEKQKELPFVKDVVLGYPGLYFYDGERMHFRGSPAMEEKQKELMPPVNVDPCDASCDAYYQRGLNKGYELGLEAGRKEQKPISTEDMPYVADEHFFEREPADSFKYKLAEYMTKCCTKKEGPYGYEYGISAETILQMAKEELIKRGELKEQKPVAWSEEDKKILDDVSHILIGLNYKQIAKDYKQAVEKLIYARPSWKPSEDQMEALDKARRFIPYNCDILESLYEQLKKL